MVTFQKRRAGTPPQIPQRSHSQYHMVKLLVFEICQQLKTEISLFQEFIATMMEDLSIGKRLDGHAYSRKRTSWNFASASTYLRKRRSSRLRRSRTPEGKLKTCCVSNPRRKKWCADVWFTGKLKCNERRSWYKWPTRIDITCVNRKLTSKIAIKKRLNKSSLRPGCTGSKEARSTVSISSGFRRRSSMTPSCQKHSGSKTQKISVKSSSHFIPRTNSSFRRRQAW